MNKNNCLPVFVIIENINLMTDRYSCPIDSYYGACYYDRFFLEAKLQVLGLFLL